jgi:hypothetical protein
MPFWRSWGAALLGASGAALAVPVGLLLVLVVVAGISGASFGGLGQLTKGPELPGIAGSGPPPATPLDGGLPALPRARTPAGAPAAPQGGAADGAGTITTTPAGGSAPTAPGAGRPPATSSTTTPPARPGTTPAPGPASTPATTPGAPPQSPRPPIVQSVQDVVGTVPVVGDRVSDAVGSITDIVVPPPAAPRLIP